MWYQQTKVNTHRCVKDLIVANRRAQVPADVEGQVFITWPCVTLDCREIKEDQLLKGWSTGLLDSNKVQPAVSDQHFNLWCSKHSWSYSACCNLLLYVHTFPRQVVFQKATSAFFIRHVAALHPGLFSASVGVEISISPSFTVLWISCFMTGECWRKLAFLEGRNSLRFWRTDNKTWCLSLDVVDCIFSHQTPMQTFWKYHNVG